MKDKQDIKLVVYVSKEQRSALEQWHVESGASVGELVRRCIDAGLTPPVRTLITKMQREKATKAGTK